MTNLTIHIIITTTVCILSILDISLTAYSIKKLKILRPEKKGEDFIGVGVGTGVFQIGLTPHADATDTDITRIRTTAIPKTIRLFFILGLWN